MADTDTYSISSERSRFSLLPFSPFNRTIFSLLSYYLLATFLGTLHLLLSAILGTATLLIPLWPFRPNRFNLVTAIITGSLGGALSAPLALYAFGASLNVLFSSRVRNSLPRRWAAAVGPSLAFALFGSPVGHTAAGWLGFIPIDCDSSARRYWKTQAHCTGGVHSVAAAALGAVIVGLIVGTIIELSCRYGKEGLWEAVEEGWEEAAGVEWRRRVAERQRLEGTGRRGSMGERTTLLNGHRGMQYGSWSGGQQDGDLGDEERMVGFLRWRVSTPRISRSPPRFRFFGMDSAFSNVPDARFPGDSISGPTLNLTRPLVVFDLRATGLSTLSSRIVEIACLKFLPSTTLGPPLRFHALVNPDVSIPSAATRVNGHTTASVSSCLPFAAIAPSLVDFLIGADLSGFNVANYGIPLLAAEFARLDPPIVFPFPSGGGEGGETRIVDTMTLFHALVPKRDLSAAHRVYVGSDFSHTHRAETDAEAAWRVLKGIVRRHNNPHLDDEREGLVSVQMPSTVEGLFEWCDAHTGKGKSIDTCSRHLRDDETTTACLPHPPLGRLSGAPPLRAPPSLPPARPSSSALAPAAADSRGLTMLLSRTRTAFDREA